MPSKGGGVCWEREGREEGGERQMKLVKEPGFIHWTITEILEMLFLKEAERAALCGSFG